MNQSEPKQTKAKHEPTHNQKIQLKNKQNKKTIDPHHFLHHETLNEQKTCFYLIFFT